MTDQQALVESLLRRRSDLERLRREWKVVVDVLAGPSALRTKTYLPQHLSEHPVEYDKRLKITPVFAETPGILQCRQGALFKKQAEVKLPDGLDYLLDRATPSGAGLHDVIARTSELCQTHGFCGVLLDRARLPEGVSGDSISRAEARDRGLGQVHLAVHGAGQILDWAQDGHGLLWIKLMETRRETQSWNASVRMVRVVRIVDRHFISTWRIIGDEKSSLSVEQLDPIAHGSEDSLGNPTVPFVFFHPFPARDGIGRPILKEAAEADVAALWVLSEICWFTYMMSPILTLTTHRNEDEIGDLGIGVSRFIPLSGREEGSHDAEKLEFVALEPTAIDRLIQVWERLVSKAKDAGSRGGAAAVAGPVEQSGISKAWTFKTTEERILFLLSLSLRSGFEAVLKQAARMNGQPKDADMVSVRFPESFDISGNGETLKTIVDAADWLRSFGLNAAVKELLRKAVESLLPNVDDRTRLQIERQIRQLNDD